MPLAGDVYLTPSAAECVSLGCATGTSVYMSDVDGSFHVKYRHPVLCQSQ